MINLTNIHAHCLAGTVYADTPVHDPRGKYRRLTQPVDFELSNGQVLLIGAGFEWDEASVPWLLHPLYPKSGIYAPSALVHDALYYLTQHPRAWVEAEFRLWMQACQLPPEQVAWRYWAVSTLGWYWYNQNLNRPSERCVRNRGLLELHHPRHPQPRGLEKVL